MVFNTNTTRVGRIIVISLLITSLNGCVVFRKFGDWAYSVGDKMPTYNGVKCENSTTCFRSGTSTPESRAIATSANSDRRPANGFIQTTSADAAMGNPEQAYAPSPNGMMMPPPPMPSAPAYNGGSNPNPQLAPVTTMGGAPNATMAQPPVVAPSPMQQMEGGMPPIMPDGSFIPKDQLPVTPLPRNPEDAENNPEGIIQQPPVKGLSKDEQVTPWKDDYPPVPEIEQMKSAGW